MQVNDSPPPAAGAAAREEARAGGEPAAERPPPGDGFRRALERKGRHPSGRGGQDTAAAAAMAGWFRSEPSVEAGRTAAVTSVAPPRTVERVLVGAGPEGAQARIRIGAGALAGTEIQLSSAASGRAVEARLLTHTASSRQTLSVVMDEIRSRLRDRGIVLSTTGAGARRGARAADLDATADGLAPRTRDGATGSSR
jgi:hypothetical protein